MKNKLKAVKKCGVSSNHRYKDHANNEAEQMKNDTKQSCNVKVIPINVIQ